MPIQKLCTVAEAVRLNGFACSLTLEAEGMEPQGPDQFVHVKCGHSRLLRRPISICGWSAQRNLAAAWSLRCVGRAPSGSPAGKRETPWTCWVPWAAASRWSGRAAACWWEAASASPMLGCAGGHGGSGCTAILGFRVGQTTRC
ncbi:MAG: hypothetical protein ACLRWQ_07490 [Flavonifractor plautii]